MWCFCFISHWVMGPGPPWNGQNEVSLQLLCSPNFILLLRATEAKVLLFCLWGWGISDKGPLREREKGESPADVRLQCLSQAHGSCSQLIAEAWVWGSFVGSGKEIPCWLWVTQSLLPRASWAHRERRQSALLDLLELWYGFTPAQPCLYNSWTCWA